MDASRTPPDLPQSDEYGVEVMCASWNPVVTAVVEPIGHACREWLAELSAVDIDGFLQKFYRSQSS